MDGSGRTDPCHRNSVDPSRLPNFRPRQSPVILVLFLWHLRTAPRHSRDEAQKLASVYPVTRLHMIWTAPSEKDYDNEALETWLWAAADQLRANSGLTSQQYSQPLLGVDFSPSLKCVSPLVEVSWKRRPPAADVAHGLMRRMPITPSVSFISLRMLGSTTCWRYRRGKVQPRTWSPFDGFMNVRAGQKHARQFSDRLSLCPR